MSTIALLASILVSALLPAGVGAQEVEDELIVGLTTEGLTQQADLHRRAGARLKKQLGARPIHVVKVDRNRAPAVRAAYAADRRVRFVEQNGRVKIAAAPTDPGMAQQWALERIQAPGAWASTLGSPEVLVGVVDTGVDANHPELRGRVAMSANFSSAATVDDRNGHGTHIAATIAAVANGAGTVGVAPDTRLLIGRALDDNGEGTYADVVEAMNWAVDNGAHVLNLSFVGTRPSQALLDAVNYAQERSVLVIAAAGNTGGTELTYPASHPGVVGVAATEPNDAVWSGSTRGPWVLIGAPGVDVYSALPGGQYGSKSGSSFAAAHVSGVAALAAAVNPSARGFALRSAVLEGADYVAGQSAVTYSAGRLNAHRAVELASQRGQPAPQTPPDSGSWRITSSGNLVGSTVRSINVSLTAPAGAAATGSVSVTDRAGGVSFRTNKIESVRVGEGVATIVATAIIRNAPHKVTMVMRQNPDGQLGWVSIGATGPAVVHYNTEADLKSGRVRIAPLAVPRQPGAPTPTRTPVTGDGGGTVVAAGACDKNWESPFNVALSYALPSALSNYTLTTLVPTQPNCNFFAGSQITITMPPTTNVNTITSATINGVSVGSVTLSSQNISFALPINLGKGLAVTIVLNNVTNPTTLGAHTLSMTGDPNAGGGTIGPTTSNAYTIAVVLTHTPTATPTQTTTPTRTLTPTVTATRTISPTPTMTHTPAAPTNTPTATATRTLTPTTTATATFTVTPTATDVPPGICGEAGQTWQSVTVALSVPYVSEVSNYTIAAKVPKEDRCQIETNTIVTVDFPGGTDASAASGTFEGTTITSWISRTATEVKFTAPVSVAKNANADIVLSGIVNPSVVNTTPGYGLEVTATNTSDGGAIVVQTSDPYSVGAVPVAATATRTRTSTSTATVTVTNTATPTATPTLTPQPPGEDTHTPTLTPTVTLTPTPLSLAVDTFNRADTTEPHMLGVAPRGSGHQYTGKTENGVQWQSDGTVWGIESNQAKAFGPAGWEHYARLINTALPADMTVTINITDSTFTGQVGFFARMSSNWYDTGSWVGINSNGVVEIWTIVSGNWTMVASGTTGQCFPCELKGIWSGGTVTVRADNFFVVSHAVPNTGASGLSAGIYTSSQSGTAGRIADFDAR